MKFGVNVSQKPIHMTIIRPARETTQQHFFRLQTQHGISRALVARKAGVDPATVLALLQHKNVRAESLQKIKTALRQIEKKAA